MASLVSFQLQWIPMVRDFMVEKSIKLSIQTSQSPAAYFNSPLSIHMLSMLQTVILWPKYGYNKLHGDEVGADAWDVKTTSLCFMFSTKSQCWFLLIMTINHDVSLTKSVCA